MLAPCFRRCTSLMLQPSSLLCAETTERASRPGSQPGGEARSCTKEGSSPGCSWGDARCSPSPVSLNEAVCLSGHIADGLGGVAFDGISIIFLGNHVLSRSCRNIYAEISLKSFSGEECQPCFLHTSVTI